VRSAEGVCVTVIEDRWVGDESWFVDVELHVHMCVSIVNSTRKASVRDTLLRTHVTRVGGHAVRPVHTAHGGGGATACVRRPYRTCCIDSHPLCRGSGGWDGGVW
jgi:hypothetical protein